jgi:hypothetical protein
MEPSAYLAPKLVKPDNVKSRFWVHFMKYDAGYHPDKKTFARCTLCGKDISVKQGTGGLKNHMKFKHPAENALLLSDDFHSGVCFPAENQSPPNDIETEASGTDIPDRNKKPRLENACVEISERRDAENRTNEKHLMEMWSLTRREIQQMRVELKDEKDEDIIRELERDVRVLQKRKADYAELLGFPKGDEDTNTVTEKVESI